MTKIVFALALAIAALATVPASAGKGCQEDLGYGRTSSFWLSWFGLCPGRDARSGRPRPLQEIRS